ncbi:hypothetical protein CGGC5_v016831 [Colletotrichum fructicola Nara gc5]|uniref:Uncharacterized protein n=1 Tax=Colletotrichum fructicola (strain Nara gc5) TaxID=1213859 RepID=A0A7J6ICL4_COLFN|nr:hypothetical protein CFRS1_v015367 [Colletotrichum fructicola]KAF4474018.1 hypothetical protein CGGC5_v017081 [Colletotrichum fructicola Nara gc5]KAF4474077.1 hypothetical protein CGGC5_v016838 [Colletotrichum fructicola Nara gc5]KAF4474250.1 hypothetical protein CGGC5_v016831 [Colletotrichum fructicola Nara gc5]
MHLWKTSETERNKSNSKEDVNNMLERLKRLYTIFAVLSALLASVVLLTFNKWPSDGPSPLASLSVSLRAIRPTGLAHRVASIMADGRLF